MSGKLLMFTKLPLMSFIYNLVERFCFLKENIKEIYKYKMEEFEIFHVLTDTDSN